YVVYQIENNIPVGLCGLVNRPTLPTVDLGFALLPAHEGKGYGTESAREVLRWAREELKLTPILAITHPENIRSQALLERLGMQFVEEKILEGGEEAVCIYEI
ncbi:MAG: GNAT family N-acetyltransferase, partial [Bacteroidota bacterium]